MTIAQTAKRQFDHQLDEIKQQFGRGSKTSHPRLHF